MSGLLPRLLPSLLAPALLLAAGLGLVGLLGLGRRPLAERLGLAYLLGLAAVPAALWLLSLALRVPVAGTTALAVAGILGAAGATRWAATRGSRVPVRSGPPSSRLARIATAAALALSAAVSAAVLADALATPVTDWDGRMTWVARARQIRQARSVRPSLLLDPAAVVAWPRYPILVPLAQAVAVDLAPDPDDDRPVRVLHALLLPAFLAVTWGAARRFAGALPAALAALALAAAPFPAFGLDGGARGTYADFPLAAFAAGGLFLLLEAHGGAPRAVATGLLLGAAALTKAEGVPLALAALAGGVLLATARLRCGTALTPHRLRRLLAPAAAAALGIGLALGLLAWWRSGIPPRREVDYVAALTVGSLTHGLSTRTVPALREAVPRLLQPERWGLLWVTVPVLLLAGVRRRPDPRALPLLSIPAAVAAVFCAAYALTTGPLVGLVDGLVQRSALQASAPLLVATALALRSALLDSRRPRW